MAAPISRIKNRPTSVVLNAPAGSVAEDLVYLDPNNDEAVLVATDNLSPSPIIGMILTKPTATKAEVVLLGEVSYTISRGYMYVGTDGKLSLTGTDTNGYLQRMGISYGNGRIYINPESMRVKRC